MTGRETARPVAVPDAPAVPGLRFRGFAGPSDFGPMAGVQNAALAADGVDEAMTPEVLANDLVGDPEIDPERDLVIVELAGVVAGWSGRWRWVEDGTGDAILSHRGYLAPAARRRGIGRALLRHNESCLRAEPAPPGGSGRRLFHSWADEAMIGTTTLLRGERYAATRWFFEMIRPTLDDLPEATLPPGLEVRPVLTEEQAVAVLLAEDEAFRDHWGHRPETDADRRRWLDDPRQDLSLWQVAYAGDEVASVVFPLVDAAENERFGRRRAWLDSVSVRRPWRRRGVARALIVGALLALRERGLTSAVLGVDADNPTGALGLYETVGFRRERVAAAYRKPADPA